LFADVFVPPCTNDSGSAIGTAADAATYFGAPCKLDWSAFAGAATAVEIDFSVGPWSFPVPHSYRADTDRIRARRSLSVVIHHAEFTHYNAPAVESEVELPIVSPGIVNALALETSVDFGTGVQTHSTSTLNPPLILPVVALGA